MGDSPEHAGPSRPDPFIADRNRRLVTRLRWTALSALVPIAASAVVNVLVFDDRLPEHLATLGMQAALCAAAATLTWHRRAEAWAVPATMLHVLGIATVQFWAIALAVQDVDVLVVAIVIVMMGSALVFPWGIGPQTVVSGYVAAGYLALLHASTLPAARIANVVIGVVIGAALSVFSAFVLERQRRDTLREREAVAALARQRELLLEAGRDLNATTRLPDLVQLIARLGHRLVGSDAASLTLLDERRRVLRPVAVAASSEQSRDFLRLEYPLERVQPFIDELARRGLLELPSGTPVDRLLDEHASSGPRRVLVACLQRDGRVFGVLSLHQQASEPRFSEQAWRLAEGFAHQASIALANARLVEELIEANRVKSEFLSTMSHELRTPLNVIIGFAEIGRDGAGSEGPDACFAKIEEAGRELFSLIQDTLQIGRLEAGRDEVRLEPVALPEFWRSLGETCRRLPRHPSVRLDWNDAAPIAGLVSDSRKLGIVVRNLVGNALKFTEAGRVSASAGREGQDLVIEVRDTGIGIAPENQALVFEKFRQVDGSDSRRFGGAGLGLYIARCYVEQLAGTVTLASTPGVGSTFTVRLPLRNAASVPSPTAA